MKRFLSVFGLILVFGLSHSTHVDASVIIVTDEAIFLNELQAGSYFNDFSSLTPDSFYSSPQSFSGGGFSYEISAAGNLYSGNGLNNWIGANPPSEPTIVSFTSGNVTAVGLNVFSTDQSNNIDGGLITVTLGSGEFQFFGTTDLSTFVGFLSTDPITSVSIAPSISFSTLTNLHVGKVVPEPSSFALLGLGGLGLGIVAYHRRRAAI